MKQRGGDCCILNHFLPFSFHLDSRSRINPAHGNKNNCESLLIIFHFFCFLFRQAGLLFAGLFVMKLKKTMEWKNFVINRFFFCFSPDGLRPTRLCMQWRHLSRSFAVVFLRNDGRLYLIREEGSLTRGNLVTSLKEKKNHHLDANDVSR
jgi:hypothetical protein